jgi:dinuclear metal center YbgI/SA1388 family protein
MTISLHKITDHLKDLFSYSSFHDSSVNGLQVEAGDKVSKIAVAVDFAESIVEKAIKEKANLLITHHGFLWGATEPLVDTASRKIGPLFRNNLSLVGIHIPLDAHEKFGNNFILARDILGLKKLKSAIEFGGQTIGCMGENSKLSLNDMTKILKKVPGALENPLALNFGPKIPKKVCVVTGAACDVIYQYEKEGFDTLITGEPRQFAYHFCKERNLNAIFAGHYATETFGVRAVGEHLSKKFKLPWVFIDEPTGI